MCSIRILIDGPVQLRPNFTADSFKSFNEAITKNLKHSKNSIPNSIAWNKIADFKDFSFKIKISARFSDGGYKWPSEAATGFKGIHIEFANSYISSWLQSLFFMNEFRRIIYSIPTDLEDVNDSFVAWLKYVFYMLQYGKCSENEKFELIECWKDMNTSDIHKFLRKLFGKLELFVKDTQLKDRLTYLFSGQLKTTKICKNSDHKSEKYEPFYDIQLQIDDDDDIFGAFRSHLSGSSISE